MTLLVDKKEIFHFLSRDPYLHIYSIGDLDDFFWPATSWFGWYESGELRAVYLLYRGFSLPVLLALEESNQECGRLLLQEMMCEEVLPAKFYGCVSPYLKEIVAGIFQIQSHGLHHKMRLASLRSAQNWNAAVLYSQRRLIPDDQLIVEEFFNTQYSGHWFDARMLDTQQYQGLFFQKRLIAAAGVHVYSEEYGVAAIGNVVTHSDFRNRGLGQYLTHRLCSEMSPAIKTIGLNIATDNLPAIKAYANIGFGVHGSYQEFLASR